MPTYIVGHLQPGSTRSPGVFEHATIQLNKGTNPFEMGFRPQTCHIYGGNARLIVPKRHKGPKPRKYTLNFGILRGNMVATPREVLSQLAVCEGPGFGGPPHFRL